MKNREVLQHMMEMMGDVATEQDAQYMSEYLYSAGWSPNSIDALRQIPNEIWQAGLEFVRESTSCPT